MPASEHQASEGAGREPEQLGPWAFPGKQVFLGEPLVKLADGDRKADGCHKEGLQGTPL